MYVGLFKQDVQLAVQNQIGISKRVVVDQIRLRKKGTENQATAIENFWRWPWISESEVGC